MKYLKLYILLSSMIIGMLIAFPVFAGMNPKVTNYEFFTVDTEYGGKKQKQEELKIPLFQKEETSSEIKKEVFFVPERNFSVRDFTKPFTTPLTPVNPEPRALLLDTTERIAYWDGKVNQHVDNLGNWLTDPDGVSGANLDKLTYCRKWYPNTVYVEEYQWEYMTTWRDVGNTGGPYINKILTDKCVQTARPVLDRTPRIGYWSGKVNQHVDDQGNWLTDPDGDSGARIDKLTYCRKWYPNTVSVEDYQTETITNWYNAANTGGANNYVNTVITDKCVQATIDTNSICEAPLLGISEDGYSLSSLGFRYQDNPIVRRPGVSSGDLARYPVVGSMMISPVGRILKASISPNTAGTIQWVGGQIDAGFGAETIRRFAARWLPVALQYQDEKITLVGFIRNPNRTDYSADINLYAFGRSVESRVRDLTITVSSSGLRMVTLVGNILLSPEEYSRFGFLPRSGNFDLNMSLVADVSRCPQIDLPQQRERVSQIVETTNSCSSCGSGYSFGSNLVVTENRSVSNTNKENKIFQNSGSENSIERGSKGSDISSIQEDLKVLGFYRGRSTGEVEIKTVKSINKYLKSLGLKPNGRLTEKQIIRLSVQASEKE